MGKQYLNLHFLLERAFVTIMHMYWALNFGIKGLLDGVFVVPPLTLSKETATSTVREDIDLFYDLLSIL